MKKRSTSKYKSIFEQLSTVVTINDLKDKDFNNEPLTYKQRLAIKNYDRYRLRLLKVHEGNEEKFHAVYRQLQAEANLLPFTEFLKEKYY